MGTFELNARNFVQKLYPFRFVDLTGKRTRINAYWKMPNVISLTSPRSTMAAVWNSKLSMIHMPLHVSWTDARQVAPSFPVLSAALTD